MIEICALLLWDAWDMLAAGLHSVGHTEDNDKWVGDLYDDTPGSSSSITTYDPVFPQLASIVQPSTDCGTDNYINGVAYASMDVAYDGHATIDALCFTCASSLTGMSFLLLHHNMLCCRQKREMSSAHLC